MYTVHLYTTALEGSLLGTQMPKECYKRGLAPTTASERANYVAPRPYMLPSSCTVPVQSRRPWEMEGADQPTGFKIIFQHEVTPVTPQ